MAEHALALEAPLGTETHRKVCEEGITQSRPNLIPDSFSKRLSFRSDLEKCTDEMIDPQLSLQSQETRLPPFQKLPTEIMILIFIMATASIRKGMSCIGSICLIEEGIRFRCTGEIFTLTWFCSEWRQIIHSAPSFWTSYQIWEPAVDSNITPMISCLNELLLRSGTATPLCIRFDFGSGLVDGTYPVLDALLQHASRWKEVIWVYWTSPRSASKYIHEQTTSFPNLETLSTVSVREYAFELGPLEKASIHCPRLHSLETTSFHHPRDIFDLQHLTTLRIVGSCKSPSFAILLQRCPVLESFFLELTRPNTVPGSLVMMQTSITIHHPHLKNLTVLFLNHGSGMTFWRNVSLPNLTKVMATGIKDQSQFDEFKQMLVDSQCVLEELDLCWYYNHPIESLIEGIRLSPQSHTHCFSMQLDHSLVFKVVPVYQKPCSYCAGEGNIRPRIYTEE